MNKWYGLGGAAAVAFAVSGWLASPAYAQVGPGRSVAIKPVVDARLRFEGVEQAALDANALTLRVRPGLEAKAGKFSFLVEGEGTLSARESYNAFPFPIADEQWRPEHAVIPDPENLELNRLQLHYRTKTSAVTLGRQRINLDDQRWVGSVSWRQNEQTFDAARLETKLGPVAADFTYAINQRTIFGSDAGPRTVYDGRFLFGGIGSKVGPVQAKLFSYVLDYDEPFFLANSSQTYGGIVSGSVPLGGKRKLNLRGSYARQFDHAENPFDYAADYVAAEAGTSFARFDLVAGWEKLGSDRGRAVQTPMATLHKFNGWADIFLTTPPAGLEDAYVTIGRKFNNVKQLPGLNAALTFHQFDSDVGNVEYGTEWDASVGCKVGRMGVLLKYANYNAEQFAGNTRKLWLQAEWLF